MPTEPLAALGVELPVAEAPKPATEQKPVKARKAKASTEAVADVEAAPAAEPGSEPTEPSADLND